MRANTNTAVSRRQSSGFTLAEVLLAGAIAALLLTALAHATIQFGYTVAHLEDKAGIADAQDSVLRRLTRDIRESWWAEVVSSTHLKLADIDGQYTEYYLDGNMLMLRRPNGDEGAIFSEVGTLLFDAATASRLREGATASLDATWYVQADPGTFVLPLEAPEDGQVAFAFVPPMDAAAVGGGASEQVLSAAIESVSIPAAFIPASEEAPGDLTIAVYAARGPGLPIAMGSAIASVTVPGASLPQANWDDGHWDVPDTQTAVALALPDGLDPSAGYTLVLSASAGASFVVPAFPVSPSSTKDLIAVKDATPGANWVQLPMIVPFSVSGPAMVTGTSTQDMIVTISVTLQQGNRPVMTRSATVLSQTLGENPWLGVVPGEEAP